MVTFGPYAVQASGDDGHFQPGAATIFSSSGAILKANSDTLASNRYTAFFRFDTVDVPAGATITDAYLTVTCVSTGVDDPNLTIMGVDADDPAAPTNDTEGDALARTTATVEWIATGVGDSGVNTPSITTIVQEIVDRGGWATGQAMQFLLEGNDDSAITCRFDSYDNTTGIATLTIDYTAPATSSNNDLFASPFLIL